MIVIVNFEFSSKSTLLGKLIKVLGSPDSILLITSNYIGPYPRMVVERAPGHDSLINVMSYIYKQIKISYGIFCNRDRTSWTLFFVGGSVLVLPMISSKIVGKKISLMATGSASKSYRHMGGGVNNANSFILSYLEKINYSLCDRLIVEAESVVDFLELQDYQEKIVVNSLSVDDRFSRTVPYMERKNIIGFIGRLSQEKGIRQFVETIPALLDLDFNFVIVGDGEEKQWIEKYLVQSGLAERVRLTGNLDTKGVVEIMNSLKLLVLPSFSEGLPNVVLESMACGTPVLATKVGGIPDVIENGITGFLTNNNSPEELSSTVRDIISREDLENISSNAESFIRTNYSTDIVRKKWEALTKLMNSVH